MNANLKIAIEQINANWPYKWVQVIVDQEAYQLALWEKYGKSRIYISDIERTDYGFFDLNADGKYVGSDEKFALEVITACAQEAAEAEAEICGVEAVEEAAAPVIEEVSAVVPVEADAPAGAAKRISSRSVYDTAMRWMDDLKAKSPEAWEKDMATRESRTGWANMHLEGMLKRGGISMARAQFIIIAVLRAELLSQTHIDRRDSFDDKMLRELQHRIDDYGPATARPLTSAQFAAALKWL